VQKHVISLLANLAPAVGTTVDFNDTIVMNYTNMYTSYNVNQTGYYAYTPILTCWDGRLSDCGDQKELEGKSGRICGYTWLGKDASALPRGKQQYDGIEMFVTSNSLGNVNGDGVLPRYDDVADQATLTHLGGENGGGKSIASTWDLSFPALAIAVSCSVASNFL
jgi:hypothetical protein